MPVSRQAFNAASTPAYKKGTSMCVFFTPFLQSVGNRLEPRPFSKQLEYASELLHTP